MRKAQVGARAGAVPEIIDEGKTGYLFSPGDSVELAERVRLLLENPTVARELGVAGYDRLKSQFDIGFNVGKTVSLYHELV